MHAALPCLNSKPIFPEAIDLRTKADVAALQHLLPDTQLPDFLFSSNAVFQAVQHATPSQSPDLQQAVAIIVANLQHLQKGWLFLLRDPYIERMLSMHPICSSDWSECTERVQQLAKPPSDPNL